LTQIIASEEKIINSAKALAEADYGALLKKHEEEIAKIQGSIDEVAKEDRKKAFLTKKFSLQIEPPSRAKLDTQLAELNARFNDFKLEKNKLADEQRKILFAVNNQEEKDFDEQRRELKQTHKSREEKLLQFQKEEKAKFEKLIEDANRQLEDQIQNKRNELKAEEEKDRTVALQPPEHHGEEQQDDDDDD